LFIFKLDTFQNCGRTFVPITWCFLSAR